MKKMNLKRIISGVLLLSFCLCAVSCKRKKIDAFDHESLRTLFDDYGAEKTEDVDEFYKAFMKDDTVKGRWFASEDSSDAQYLYDTVANRFNQHPDCHPTDVSMFYALKEEYSYLVVYLFTTKKEITAQKIYASMSLDLLENDFEGTASSGEKDGYKYTTNFAEMDDDRFVNKGVYLKDNSFIYIQSYGKTEDAVDEYNKFIKKTGLILPEEAYSS